MVVIEEYLKQRGVNRWGVRGWVVEQILVIGHYFCLYFLVHFSTQLHFTFLT